MFWSPTTKLIIRNNKTKATKISTQKPKREEERKSEFASCNIFTTMSPSSSSSSSSSRWSPTPEQLMILEELYRSGIRTPNASQIQRITAHLSLYGKIEGKNVFYWFQNHKARDRQKLRRKLISQLQQQHRHDHQQQLYCHDSLQLNQSDHHRHHHLLLNYFDPPTTSAFRPLSYHNSSSLLPQGGIEGATPTETMNYTWKVEVPQRVQMENSMMRMYGHDWKMLMDVGPPQPNPCCTTPTRPLTTLQLFPITSTNLKEESSSSSNNNNNS